MMILSGFIMHSEQQRDLGSFKAETKASMFLQTDVFPSISSENSISLEHH